MGYCWKADLPGLSWEIGGSRLGQHRPWVGFGGLTHPFLFFYCSSFIHLTIVLTASIHRELSLTCWFEKDGRGTRVFS